MTPTASSDITQMLTEAFYPLVTAFIGLVVAWLGTKTARYLDQKTDESRDLMIESAIHFGIEYSATGASDLLADSVYEYVTTHVPETIKQRKLTDDILRQKITARIAAYNRRTRT